MVPVIFMGLVGGPSFMGGVQPFRHHVLKKKSILRQIEWVLYFNLPFPVFFISLC